MILCRIFNVSSVLVITVLLLNIFPCNCVLTWSQRCRRVRDDELIWKNVPGRHNMSSKTRTVQDFERQTCVVECEFAETIFRAGKCFTLAKFDFCWQRAEKTLFDHGLPDRLNFKSTYNKKLFLFQFCLLKDSSALGQGLYIWKEKTRLSCRRKAYSCQPAASGVLTLI